MQRCFASCIRQKTHVEWWRWHRQTPLLLVSASLPVLRPSGVFLIMVRSMLGHRFTRLRVHTGDSGSKSTWNSWVCHLRLAIFLFIEILRQCAFRALMLLVWCQEEHPACKNWIMTCWCGYLSGARCRLFAYGPADATAVPKPHHLLPYLNPDWF